MTAPLPTPARWCGLKIYAKLVDRSGTTIRVQRSSLATEPAVRVFGTRDDHHNWPPHLTVEQARQVRDALSQFLRDAGHENPYELLWAAGWDRATGLGFLADTRGGRFDFDLDADNVESLKDALDELLEGPPEQDEEGA
jgi:hypothetical protein